MGVLLAHAARELRLISKEISPEEQEAALKLVRLFEDINLSEKDAKILVSYLEPLLTGRLLSPLTDDPDEWVSVSFDNSIHQSIRNPKAFSHDGGKTYYTIDNVPCRRHPSNTAEKEIPNGT